MHTSEPPTVVPIAMQPRGMAFFIGTWTGRIILVNAAIFVLMAWASHNLIMPAGNVLIEFGAKDPVLLAKGEYWRFITPVFVHIGLIHFAFNTWALYVLAYQLEHLLKKWFLVLYLLSGVLGNIASSVFSLATSAGASGALFGLLGCGFFVERMIGNRVAEQTGQRPRRGAYTAMVVANIILGTMIPQIDNAAHIGGLVTGILFTIALTSLIPNRLLKVRPVLGKGVIVLIALAMIGGVYYATSPTITLNRLVTAGDDATQILERYHYYTDAVRLAPQNSEVRYKRGRLLVEAGYREDAREDLETAVKDPQTREKIVNWRQTLMDQGQLQEATFLDELLGMDS